ncbi:MAG: hypothetical protein EBS05_15335 [Proteobacteria bacterium]|nr:hypothetical protein [Pseudomonadota bacterium]
MGSYPFNFHRRINWVLPGLVAGLVAMQTAWAQAATNDWSRVPPDAVRAAAIRGEAGAQWFLGRALFRGEGVTQDVPTGVEWLERAAEQGVLEAQLMAGAARERGIGSRIDFGKAMAWYRLAADQGNPGAQLRLGWLHLNSRPGGKVDFSTAMTFILPLARQGYTAARFAASVVEQRSPPPSATNLFQANHWLIASARDGLAAAQWQLGIRYDQGQKSKPDFIEAAKWYELAARQGHTNAAAALAKLSPQLSRSEREYAKELADQFVPRPAVQLPVATYELLHPNTPVGAASPAFNQLQAAADKGDAVAQFRLGLTLLLREDDAHLAAALGRGWSASNGQITSGGGGPTPPEVEAAKWLKAAAEQGHAGAQFQLALHLIDPLSRGFNKTEGLRWLQAAANSSLPAAQFQLARLHQEGGAGRKDLTKAARWLRRAADQGHAPAQTNLAALAMDAKQLGADYGEGVRWLRLAAAGGHPQARRDLRRIFGAGFDLNVTPPVPPAPAAPATPGNPASSALKLAILAAGPDVRPVADLLTVLLSQSPGVTLLERAEIERAWREQSLSASGRSSLVKLGEILGADGVLLLETNSVAGQNNLSARLVAVKTGVTLGHLAVALPLMDLTEWSGQAASQFIQWLPKLTVARKEAVPVSILNLRSALNTTRAVALERDLTLLLTERLLRQREVFVLERRRLDQLATERELHGGSEENAFWSGSFMLEGVINKDGEQAGRVAVLGRLIPPGGGVATQVQVEGDPAELPRLVNELAGKVFTVLHQPPTDASWGTPEEAAKYFEEARWASRWGMRPEARAAADAAWALGLHGVELATMRLDGWTTELQATATTRERSRYTARGYPVPFFPPDPRQLEMALQALSFFTSYGDLPTETEKELRFTWLSAGLRAVDQASSVLRHFYGGIDVRGATTESLAELRALARLSYERVAASPLVTNGVMHLEVRHVRPDHTAIEDRTTELLPVWVRGSSYWLDDVGQSRTFLTKLVTHPAYFGASMGLPTLRDSLLRPLPLTCWTVAERQAVSQTWATLVEEWGNSTNAALRIEGQLRRFELQPAMADAEVQARAAQLLELVWELRTNLLSGAISPHVGQFIRSAALIKLRQGPNAQETGQQQVLGLMATSIRPRGEAALLGPFEQKWNEFNNLLQQEQETAKRQQAELAARRQWEEHKDYLRTAQTYEDGRFTSQYLHRKYSVAEMEELLPLLRPYGDRMGWPVWPRTVADRMAKSLGLSTNQPPPKPTVQASAPRPPPKQAPAKTTASQTNGLQTVRFWTPPAKLFSEQFARPSGPLNIQFAEGLIWTGLRSDSFNELDRQLALVAVQPDTLRTQTYPLPKSGVKLPAHDGMARPFFPGYVAWQGQVHLQLGDKLMRLKLNSGRWDELPVAVPDNSNLSVAHGRLYVSTADSILELNEAGDGTRLLASTRRRPAETPLDTLGTLAATPMFPGPGGVVRVVVNLRLFEHDPRTRNWREIAPPPQQPTLLHEQNATFATRGFSMGRQNWYGMFDDESEWSYFFDTIPPSPGISPQGGNSTTKTRWRLPDSIVPYLMPTVGPGKDVWNLSGWLADEAAPDGGFRWKATGDRHTTLLYFPVSRSTPYLIPLRLETAAKADGSPQSHMQNTHWAPLTKLIATGDGVIITDKRAPTGFWVLTKAELGPFLQQQEQQAVSQNRVGPATQANQSDPMRNSLLAEFDRNRNGILDPEEERAARANPVYKRLLDRELTARWLKTFDANGDGQLDEQEYAAFLAAPLEMDGRKWTPPPFATALQFDLNRDRRLDQRELLSLFEAAINQPEAKKP